MFNLLYKDYIVGRKIMLFSLLCIIYISIVGLNMSFQTPLRVIYTFGIVFITYLITLNINNYDEKNKCEIALNSFPVKRTDIIKSKYINLIIFALFTGIAMIIITSIIILFSNDFYGNGCRITDILNGITILSIFFSIYFPMYYKFGLDKLRLLNYIVYMMFCIIPVLLNKISAKSNILKNLSKLNLPEFELILFLFSIILLFFSFLLSSAIYKNKEF